MQNYISPRKTIESIIEDIRKTAMSTFKQIGPKGYNTVIQPTQDQPDIKDFFSARQNISPQGLASPMKKPSLEISNLIQGIHKVDEALRATPEGLNLTMLANYQAISNNVSFPQLAEKGLSIDTAANGKIQISLGQAKPDVPVSQNSLSNARSVERLQDVGTQPSTLASLVGTPANMNINQEVPVSWAIPKNLSMGNLGIHASGIGKSLGEMKPTETLLNDYGSSLNGFAQNSENNLKINAIQHNGIDRMRIENYRSMPLASLVPASTGPSNSTPNILSQPPFSELSLNHDVNKLDAIINNIKQREEIVSPQPATNPIQSLNEIPNEKNVSLNSLPSHFDLTQEQEMPQIKLNIATPSNYIIKNNSSQQLQREKTPVMRRYPPQDTTPKAMNGNNLKPRDPVNFDSSRNGSIQNVGNGDSVYQSLANVSEYQQAETEHQYGFIKLFKVKMEDNEQPKAVKNQNGAQKNKKNPVELKDENVEKVLQKLESKEHKPRRVHNDDYVESSRLGSEQPKKSNRRLSRKKSRDASKQRKEEMGSQLEMSYGGSTKAKNHKSNILLQRNVENGTDYYCEQLVSDSEETEQRSVAYSGVGSRQEIEKRIEQLGKAKRRGSKRPIPALGGGQLVFDKTASKKAADILEKQLQVFGKETNCGGSVPKRNLKRHNCVSIKESSEFFLKNQNQNENSEARSNEDRSIENEDVEQEYYEEEYGDEELNWNQKYSGRKDRRGSKQSKYQEDLDDWHSQQQRSARGKVEQSNKKPSSGMKKKRIDNGELVWTSSKKKMAFFD